MLKLKFSIYKNSLNNENNSVINFKINLND